MKEHGWRAFLGRVFRRLPPPEIPGDLWQDTLARNPVFQRLDAAERQRLKTLSEAFLAEKEFCGAQGFALRDDILAMIAAQACLPILELGLAAYRGWVGIIIYPDEFIIPRAEMDEAGIVRQYEDVVVGEAWEGGPVILSWRDAQQAEPVGNVVIHEFAHKLDMRNGEADGIPALHSGLTLKAWKTALLDAYDDFCLRLEQGSPLPMDAYGGEDLAEFFAVASECFFVAPERLRAAYPEVYQVFSRYYCQDPAARGAV
jgi:Mlc titration factor MtfA (ptsG expression regulator)